MAYHVGPKMGVGKFHDGFGRVLYLRQGMNNTE